MQAGVLLMAGPKNRPEKSDSHEKSERQTENSVWLRIVDALDGRDLQWLSREAAVPGSTLSDAKSRGIAKAEVAIRIADALQVSLDWLLTGRGGRSAGSQVRGAGAEKSVTVPEYDIEVAAGAGRFAFDQAEPIGHWPFPAAWLAQFGDVRNLKLVTVVGDSQEPEFGDGDRVLVDTAATKPRDGMHVVRKDDALLVKRLQVQGSTIVLKSANPIYADILVELPGDQDAFQVIGRVVGAVKVVGNPWAR